MSTTNKTIGIYIHVPFCAKKCPYCDFYSVKYSTALERMYFDALQSDIVNVSRTHGLKDTVVDAIYFGGGTPSLVQPEYIKSVIECIKNNFTVQYPEITMEINPCTVNRQKFSYYAQYGVNRVSFGMQSASTTELTALGRAHTVSQVETAIALARSNDITNISLDFMLGTPFQTRETVQQTLGFIDKQSVPHVSSYLLKIEDGTPYAQSDIISHCPDEDTTAQIYLDVVDGLNSIGINQYEISNFGKLGYEGRHNLKYWNSDDYLGFGASAHSYFNNKRFYYQNDIEHYINTQGQDKIYEDESDFITTNTMGIGSFEEYSMLKLRLVSGLDLNIAEKIHPTSFDRSTLEKKLKKYEIHGLLTYKCGIISLTPKGFLLSNSIISDLF